MSGAHASLDAAATERKARLAKLASLKRKQPGSDITVAVEESSSAPAEAVQTGTKTDHYISGRNYDKVNKAPKLGFENAPSSDQETLEQQAERLAAQATEQAAKDEAEAAKGIDLFKLQPKKPNWDLKRDLAEKMRILDVRTQNAIARLVRQRIESQKKEALKTTKGSEVENGEELGIDGSTLVEGVHQREQEDQEQERRERELEDNELV